MDRYQYILTIQDVFSRYLWLRPLTYKTSKVVSKALGDLYIEVGPPKVLQSDRGGEFKKWVKKMCKNLNVKMIQSRPYHPQSQGKVKRSHRALRKKIAFDFGHLRKSGVNWAKQLKEYQKLQNEESMEALGNKSPFEAVLNHIAPNLRILGAIFDKMHNNAPHQLIFTPMFQKVKWSHFSEIFTRGNYMLEDSVKTRMPFIQALWTYFAITFKTTLFLLYFDILKIYS